MHPRGFTLIELLVVIAIIGILSAVVLASLNTARGKGSDAAIKQDLNSIRNNAEIYYLTNGGYGTPLSCPEPTLGYNCGSNAGSIESIFKDPEVTKAIYGAYYANGNIILSCCSDGNNYAVSSPFKSDSAKHWCVDSSGTSQEITAPVAGTSC